MPTNNLLGTNANGTAPHRCVAYAAPGDAAVAVDAGHPLPTSERGYQGVVAIVPGIDQAPQRAVAVACSVAGTLVLKLADDSTIALPVTPGLAILPFAAKTVATGGTTATAICSNLI